MPEVKYTPFGTPIRATKPSDCSKKELAQFGLELDKETGCTVIVQKDPVDLDELVQSYRDQCGMVMAQNLIARGLASPEDFAAQPGDYGDTSTLPDNINDAYQASLKAQESGVDLSQFKTDQDIQDYVNKMIEEKLAAAKAAPQGSETAASNEVK